MRVHAQIALKNRLIAILPGLAEIYQNYCCWKILRAWRRNGWSTPLPALIKRAIIKAAACRFKAEILVETGTYLGDTPWFFRKDFRRIYSVEIEPRLAALARRRFKSWPNVTIMEGDSADILASLVPQLHGRVLFWLDGHYSADITGRGKSDCPVWAELTAIFDRLRHPFCILIDDARLFGTDPLYPTIPSLSSFLSERRLDYLFKVENDIIFLWPREVS
jgi:hypothetical protein